jgi:hypothetical protein
MFLWRERGTKPLLPFFCSFFSLFFLLLLIFDRSDSLVLLFSGSVDGVEESERFGQKRAF